MKLFFRLFKESIMFAIQSLVVNKLRTFLSLIGVTIGIFAIISVLTLVDTMERNVKDSISSLGDDQIFIQKFPIIFSNDYPWWKYFTRPEPSLRDYKELKQRVKLADAVSFKVEFSRTVSYENNSVERAKVIGATHEYNVIRNFNIQSGRYFTQGESQSGRAVAIIGPVLAENLFGKLDPIGKTMKIKGWKTEIIGVFEKEGENIFNYSTDEVILVPLQYSRSFVNIKSGRNGPIILAKVQDGYTNEALKEELTGLMRSIRRQRPTEENNFALNETSLISQGFDEVFKTIKAAGWVIGLFSILVGGFGIANIMFVSVKERTAQIGIQKSLGAKSRFILFQFLSEAVILCLIGGLIGLGLIFLGTVIASAVSDYEVVLTLDNMLVGIAISTVIGLVSGILPASSAARLDPVIAIRSK